MTMNYFGYLALTIPVYMKLTAVVFTSLAPFSSLCTILLVLLLLLCMTMNYLGYLALTFSVHIKLTAVVFSSLALFRI